jgi:hypothetical protein
MISIDKITIEYKSTALFGITALLLSFIIGIIAGVTWNIVILRSFVLAVVFAAIGYGTCLIFKRFVPELYQILASTTLASNGQGSHEDATAVPDHEAAQDASIGVDELDMSRAEEHAGAPAETFKELDKEDLDRYSSSGGAGGVNTGAGKLGKHILEKEKLAKYEPKIMAQAVRTMMSRD